MADELAEGVGPKKISRREFLKTAGVFAGAGLLTACGAPGKEDTPQENESYGNIVKLETEYNNKFIDPIFPETSENDKVIKIEELNNILDSGRILSPDINELVDPRSGQVNVSSLSETVPAIIAPFLQVASQSGLDRILTPDNINLGTKISWTEFFHWTNHAPEVGKSIFDIVSYGRYQHAVINGALQGGGSILHRPETVLSSGTKLQEAYMFIRSFGKQQWVTILAQNGSPITAFDSAIRHGKYNPNEAARMMRKFLEIARQINPEEVPGDIVKNWKDNPPPLIRYVAWSLQSKAAELAAKYSLSSQKVINGISTFMKSPIIIVPTAPFTCEQDGQFDELETLICPPAVKPST
ncbi:MAG: hypothetical protein US95_C0043G0010 [Candidatus Woesebacteria bacterium GW2011_GWB1_38_5]|uniref:Twin-arginine translocation signal domain-containing protein n=4 Tax=Candidatus Woeseibacteriota TaxID=1752722 RepID=A0A0G0KED2_9BACT|nr:MAG: hypothetical protein US67_C0043G0007 [Candidatus Woesebacteria bacterium GW2011_GWD1_38_10]KKQ55323.1 MAG: hypothetical protein US75_C0025G0003 [Candidatus Woesebacteria bacterium GW2011_GWC1_38_13]KKQ73855.1 MAG: hypothetical protein US95_C0043G0010 [Candidatus Woesebacteria bacterium GW2011_GWB1_38_5]KKQ76200.1 MAG: hypothetical protein US97_C0017G0007 [Microgenomates group bacterium GW2011_GWF1_38_5]KKQ83184.1 MAG: hypothetical protein UT06_C0026G0007 [Candidatus Woesebacteria bacter